MQDWIRNMTKAWSRGRGKRIVGLIALPLVVILLVLIIVVVDHKESKPADIQTTETAATEVATTDVEESEAPRVSLLKDEIPELTALVQAYCQAKLDCDVEALAAVFGMTDSEALSEEAANMELVSRIVDSYENVACYSVAGPEADTYVIYPYFEIQYKEAMELMPSLTWSFVRKKEDGQFHMVQNITDKEKEYIAEVSQSLVVQQLKDEVIARQDTAVMADAKLQRIYN